MNQNQRWIVRLRYFPCRDGFPSQVSFNTLAWYIDHLWSFTKDKPAEDGSYIAGIDIDLMDMDGDQII